MGKEHKNCRKCGTRITNQYIYCRECIVLVRSWLIEIDHFNNKEENRERELDNGYRQPHDDNDMEYIQKQFDKYLPYYKTIDKVIK